MTTSTESIPTLPELVGALIARDRWSRAELEEHQRTRVQALIAYAVERSPYYREALGPDAEQRPLAELPVLTKATLMERFDEVVTDRRLRRADVEAHLRGADPGADFADEHALVTTSGTTGARGVFVYSRSEMRVWLAANLRILARIGATPGMRIVGIGSPSPLFMSRRVFGGLQGAGGSAPPEISVVTPIPEAVAALNEFRPEVILGYPSVIALLAHEQLAGRLDIAPKAIGCGSEVLTEDDAQRIESAWGVAPGNAYVTTEACPIASTCPRRVGLHIAEDLVVVEVVDEAGHHVEPGTPGHRVLVTNLVNRTQPLIRYELTDSVTLAPEPNPTGMPWRRIERVDGRTAEILRLPGRDGDVQVHPHQLRAPLSRFEHVLQYQFRYDGRTLAVAIVPRADAPHGLADAVRDALDAALADAGVTGIAVDARAVSEIPREPGGAAKLKQIKVEPAS